MSAVKLIVKHTDGITSMTIVNPCVRIEIGPDNQRFNVTIGNADCIGKINDVLNIEENFSVIETVQNITAYNKDNDYLTVCYDDEQDKVFVVSGLINVDGFTKISPIVKSGWIEFRDYVHMIGKDLMDAITK